MNLFTDAKIGILLETMVDIEIFVTFDVSYWNNGKPKQTEAVRSFLYRYPLLFFLSLIICYSADKFQIFYCYCGMAYSDIENFNYEKDVVSSGGNYFIEAHRQKTNTSFYVMLLEPALKILKNIIMSCLQFPYRDTTPI